MWNMRLPHHAWLRSDTGFSVLDSPGSWTTAIFILNLGLFECYIQLIPANDKNKWLWDSILMIQCWYCQILKTVTNNNWLKYHLLILHVESNIYWLWLYKQCHKSVINVIFFYWCSHSLYFVGCTCIRRVRSVFVFVPDSETSPFLK